MDHVIFFALVHYGLAGSAGEQVNKYLYPKATGHTADAACIRPVMDISG